MLALSHLGGVGMSLRAESFAFILLLGALTSLPALSTDMSLPALTVIASDLQTTIGMSSLTLSTFLLGYALSPLCCGPLADLFGRRPVLLLGCALYVGASVLCTVAPNIETLLTARVLQGAGGGAGNVLVMTVVQDLFKGQQARERLSYIATLRLVVPMLAPTAGGALLILGDWRLIYGVMSVAGLILLAVLYWRFPETRPSMGSRPQGLFRTMAHHYWEALTHRACLLNSLVNACLFGSLFAYIAGSPMLMMDYLGLSPQAFGVTFACTAGGIMVGSLINARLNRRGVSPYFIVRNGLTLAAVSAALLLVLLLGGSQHLGLILICLVVHTMSFGLVASNVSHAAVSSVPHLAGSASAVVSSLMMGVGTLSSGLVPLLGIQPLSLSTVLVMTLFTFLSGAVFLRLHR